MGREAELAEVVANLLEGPPAATLILGAPGVGKTNLALAALHRAEVVARYGSGRAFVRCEGAASAAAVVAELAAALGLRLTGGWGTAARLPGAPGREAGSCVPGQRRDALGGRQAVPIRKPIRVSTSRSTCAMRRLNSGC